VLKEHKLMYSAILGFFLLAGGFFSGLTGINRFRPLNPISITKSAPELDPSALGAGLMILGGGLLALNERRLKNKRNRK
jgi:hypothetical protein